GSPGAAGNRGGVDASAATGGGFFGDAAADTALPVAAPDAGASDAPPSVGDGATDAPNVPSGGRTDAPAADGAPEDGEPSSETGADWERGDGEAGAPGDGAPR